MTSLAPPTARAQEITQLEQLLRGGDTAAAIQLLERQWTAHPTCLLPSLVARLSTSATSDWRRRARAQDLFEQVLRGDATALCWYEYAGLKVKQGTSTEARRALGRAEAMLARRPEENTPQFRAALLYRRAALLDDWIRNFDHLVQPPPLAVSTPACIYHGYFCENFAKPGDFNRRLAAAGDLSSAVGGEREAVISLLDSSLALDARNLEARRLRLYRALVSGDWPGFAGVAREGIEADSAVVLPWLALLAAEVRDGDLASAARALARVDSLLADSVRSEFERLETITTGPGVRDADALWRLSDPLYLTSQNERRIQHYARIALADIAFTDPLRGVRGRDTQPGRLVLRYGWPRHIWDVRRDGRLELDPDEMRAMFQMVACGTKFGPGCEAAGLVGTGRTSAEAHGRWTFFNYGDDVPNFVFERNLSSLQFEYKRMTMTEQLDSALARVLPSSFESPYVPGVVKGMVTRFPRPDAPVLEIAAEFAWDEASASPEDSVHLGVFVHERYGGRLVNRGTQSAPAAAGSRFGGRLPVIAGPLQVSLEGWVPNRAVAAQARVSVAIPAVRDSFALSDLLLARPLGALGEVERREDVRVRPLTEAIAATGDTLALYWEAYGLAADTTGAVEYEVLLSVREVGAGNVAASFLRVAGGVLGLRRNVDETLVWNRRRRATPGYLSDAIQIGMPDRKGTYELRVTVRDLTGKRTAEAAQVVEVR